MKMLLIETATQVCSTVLASNGAIVAHRESSQPNAHSSLLAVFIDEMLREASLVPADLDAVCVSAGPGSYTGLRIGVSTAKGLCYALGKPLVSVPTLQSMAALYYRQHPDYHGLVCPMIDARRMECYTAVVDPNLEMLRPIGADVIEAGIYDRWLEASPMVFIGDGAAKTRPLLGNHPNAIYDDNFVLSAEGMLPVAMRKLESGQTEDVAYFEPFYLKDFVAKKSVVHGLR